jgi:purine-binding chemotaxis protein CheW
MGTAKTGKYEIDEMLREMREEYWRGLSETEDLQEEQLECIRFSLGGESYAFETCFASEVIRIPKLVKLPRVQDFIVGVFNLRGEITAAMDIRPLLGLSQPPLTSAARIVVVKSDKLSTGLIVEGVQGVAPLPFSTFEPAVKSLEGGRREYIRGQLTVEGSLVILLDVVKLLADPEIIVG